MRAWFDRFRSGAKEEACEKAGVPLSCSGEKDLTQRRAYHRVFGNDRRIGRRQGPRLRTACRRHPFSEPPPAMVD